MVWFALDFVGWAIIAVGIVGLLAWLIVMGLRDEEREERRKERE